MAETAGKDKANEMETQEQIMAKAGYVSASRAAEAVGITDVGSFHKRIARGTLKGVRAGKHWYVSVRALLDEYKDAQPIYDRIVALGVKPEKDDAPRKGRRGHGRAAVR